MSPSGVKKAWLYPKFDSLGFFIIILSIWIRASLWFFFRISKHQSSSVRNLRLRAINYFQWGSSCLFMLYVSALSNSLCDFLAGLAGDLVCNPSRVSFSFRSCLALAIGRPHSTTLNAEPFYISKVSGGKSSTKKAIRGCKHLRHNHRHRYLLTFPHLREKCFWSHSFHNKV